MANTAKLDKYKMKKLNRQLIFSLIIRNESISRVQLAKLSDMSLMSVGRIADDMIKLGIVAEVDGDNADPKVGRRSKFLKASTDSFLSIGLELHRDGINIGIINLKGQTLRRIKHSLDLSSEPVQSVLETVSGLIERIIFENRDLPVTASVGIACPGLIDDGVIRFSSQLKWRNIHIVKELQRLTGINNIYIDNEVKARAVAEDLFGAGKQYDSSVLLNIGSGVGSAAVVNHELYRGKLNMAGEIGHIRISHAGNMCECGQRGCLQTYITDRAILREARAVKDDIELGNVFVAYLTGEQWAKNLINHVLEYIATTINILANTFAPEVIILCGSLIEDYSSFKDIILQNCKSTGSEYELSSFNLVASDFSSDATLVGAVTLANYKIIDQII